jgi:toxin FitB
MNVVDSSGWIEFFLGTPAGRIYKPVVEQTDQLIVPALALFEVHKFLSRSIDTAQRDVCLEIMRRGTVVPVTDARAIAASTVAQQHKLAMADAVMYSIALEHKATLWTQDVDYQGLAGVRYTAKT